MESWERNHRQCTHHFHQASKTSTKRQDRRPFDHEWGSGVHQLMLLFDCLVDFSLLRCTSTTSSYQHQAHRAGIEKARFSRDWPGSCSLFPSHCSIIVLFLRGALCLTQIPKFDLIACSSSTFSIISWLDEIFAAVALSTKSVIAPTFAGSASARSPVATGVAM